ncbi:MAG TPA: hypothetical protein DCK99_14795 [Blastocatellia bacterium]|nr:hypothetical protein [Blastocatellia bacterium]
MLPISPCAEFVGVNKRRFLQSSRQSFASCHGKHLGEVTTLTLRFVVLFVQRVPDSNKNSVL